MDQSRSDDSQRLQPGNGLSYAMNCDGTVDVVCTGGDNALVQFSLGP
jgi:hypothetical protein